MSYTDILNEIGYIKKLNVQIYIQNIFKTVFIYTHNIVKIYQGRELFTQTLRKCASITFDVQFYHKNSLLVQPHGKCI